ncbi:AbiTii domain-containing protein [Devosia sp. A369]
MKLLDDIIENATSSTVPIADLLRQCLVLGFKLKNDKLKAWVEHELNGYDYYGEIPDYRLGVGQAKGVFTGPFGMQLNDKPLPAYILKKEHRHFANEVRLVQPIGAYEGADRTAVGNLTWPADLIGMYQEKFIEGMALHSAWIEIPGSMTAGMFDVVRTRILTMALEIQAELPEDTEKAIEQIPAATVERIVQVAIYGGNNNIGANGVINANVVVAGDAGSLKAALEGLGLTDQHAAELQKVIEEDGKTDSPGKKTLAWIGKTAKAGAKAGLKIGGEVAKEALTAYVKQFMGVA